VEVSVSRRGGGVMIGLLDCTSLYRQCVCRLGCFVIVQVDGYIRCLIDGIENGFF